MTEEEEEKEKKRRRREEEEGGQKAGGRSREPEVCPGCLSNHALLHSPGSQGNTPQLEHRTQEGHAAPIQMPACLGAQEGGLLPARQGSPAGLGQIPEFPLPPVESLVCKGAPLGRKGLAGAPTVVLSSTTWASRSGTARQVHLTLSSGSQ